MVSGAKGQFMCQDVEIFVKEAQIQKQALCYILRRIQLEVKVDDFVLLEEHQLSSRRQIRVPKFGPKMTCQFEVLEVRRDNFVIDVDGEKHDFSRQRNLFPN